MPQEVFEMPNLFQKMVTILCGLVAFWFSFIFVNQPLVPLYHNLFLFVVSWMLFYSLVSIAFQPPLASDALKDKKKRTKVRRKKSAAVEVEKS
jgi:multidrug efflux pump subunit AcrB